MLNRIPLRVDLIEYLVPSDDMIREVLATLTTSVDQQKLAFRSNYWVETIPHYLASVKEAEIQSVYRSICLRLGFSYNALLLAQLKTWWYDCISLNASGHQCRYQSISDFYSATKGVYSGQKYPPKKFIDWAQRLSSKTDPLIRFNQYREALRQVDNVLFAAAEGACSDTVLRHQFLTLLELIKCGSYESYQQGSVLSQQWTQCKYCGQLFEYSAGVKHPAHCGNSECEKQFQRLKPSKQKRGLSAQGWGSTRKRGNCAQCGEKRVLNLNQNCRECFLETLA